MPAMVSTSGSIHSEFVRLLFLQTGHTQHRIGTGWQSADFQVPSSCGRGCHSCRARVFLNFFIQNIIVVYYETMKRKLI
jgi:hypothetical protein